MDELHALIAEEQARAAMGAAEEQRREHNHGWAVLLLAVAVPLAVGACVVLAVVFR